MIKWVVFITMVFSLTFCSIFGTEVTFLNSSNYSVEVTPTASKPDWNGFTLASSAEKKIITYEPTISFTYTPAQLVNVTSSNNNTKYTFSDK